MDISDIISKLNRFGLEFFGHYYSSYPGYVVENEDHQGLQRLQIIIPTILGTESRPLWAYRKSVSPRVQDLPQIGDMVWIEFMNGRLNAPIWSHYYPLEKEKIEEFIHPKCYGFKSPAGYLVIIDELDKSLFITTPEGISRKFTDKAIIDTSEEIYLTKEDADKKVPLGQDLDSDIKDALNKVKDLLEKLIQFGTAQATASTGPSLPLAPGFATLATDAGVIMADLVSCMAKFEDESHLSEKVKLT